MTIATDPRLDATVFVKHAGRTHALTTLRGSPGAPVNLAVREIASAAQHLLVRADDIRASTAGPAEQGFRLREASGAALKVLNERAKAISAARSATAKSMAVRPIPPYGDGTTFWAVTADLALAQKFAAMPPTARATTLHRVRAEPEQNMNMLAALLRAPRELSELAVDEHAGLGTVAIRALKPDDFKMLSNEMEVVEAATAGVRRARELLIDVGVHRQDVVELAPEVDALISAGPLRWAPERPEDAA